MTLWKPAKYKTDRVSAKLVPQTAPEKCFPIWDRGPDSSIYVAVVIEMKGTDGKTFHFDVWDRDGGTLKPLNVDIHVPVVEGDEYFFSHPSTVEKWLEKPVLGQFCILMVSHSYLSGQLGLPDSAHFLSEGKWPRGLGGVSGLKAFMLLVKAVQLTPAALARLSQADQKFLRGNFPALFPKP